MRNLIFYPFLITIMLKMHQKPFGGGALPGWTCWGSGELPDPATMGPTSKERGKRRESPQTDFWAATGRLATANGAGEMLAESSSFCF